MNRHCFILSLLLLTLSSSAKAVLIDLNDFFADPTVTVALDGSTATFLEDPGFFSVLLSNDPFFGDPIVILPEIGGIPQILSFDFDFIEGAGVNDDEFGAFVIDASTGVSVGAAFEFFTTTSSSGTVSFDLESLIGGPALPLGLQFQLSSLFGDVDFNSKVTVSSVTLSEIPEPTSMGIWAIIFLGAGCVAHRRRKRMRKAE